MEPKTETTSDNLIVKYWGIRGSIPTPLSPAQVKKKEELLIQKILEDGVIESFRGNPGAVQNYLSKLPPELSGTFGGNTTCIEVRAKDSPLIVIDAGSGMRDLGNSLIGKLFSGQNFNPLSSDEATKRDVHLLLTHYHWDHLQGLPFFGPAFIGMEGKTINMQFYGKKDATKSIGDVLAGQQEYPNFPVVWDDMPCEKGYHPLGRMIKGQLNIGQANVAYQELNHPDGVFAYRINANGKSFVCATDTEHRDIADPRLVQLAKGADVLYYDAQYTPDEYSGKKGMARIDWGHSTYEWAVKNALAANVKTVVLGHHEPTRDDWGLAEVRTRAEEYAFGQLKSPENAEKHLTVVMAYEGLEQKL